ncbi:hypothetical protein [Pseudorhodoferax sp. Leaf265]|uniref:hypothetical protein n=1 Tax=Pseudorhodoferax sp. Leaf265 TaxID=1736315 RepID=UPI0007239ED3|nr:hypothetical protein [Pseudorhodoferax sp. Leaf265]KQP02502.1 hypothetical protein ASF45_20835 [Pseudorhodoferax sp. Leaf265]
MSTPHTRGPWAFVTDFRCANGELTVGVKSDHTGQAIAWPCGKNDAEEIANGRLLSTAAEMYDWMIEARSELRDLLTNAADAKNPDQPHDDLMAEVRANPLLRKADRLIAKASGQGTG